MKVIDAYWEKRNLGVDTKELVCEMSDALLDVKEQIQQLSAKYMVVKVPSERTDLSEFVQKAGFYYVEDLIEVTHDLHETVRNPLHQRLYDSMSYRRMNEEDVQQLYKEIQAGLFETDRISKDMEFGKEKAARRYENWIKDMISQGAVPYVILYKEEPAGFIILQSKDKKTYTSVLGGGYEKFRSSGLGIVQKEQEIVKKLGGKRVVTHVSSNNPSQLKALMLNGYLPKDIQHVFIKHEKKGNEEK